MAPSATTTRVASASRRASARVWVSAGGFGNEAMVELPGMRRLSALHPLCVKGARGQGNRAAPDPVRVSHVADCILCAGRPLGCVGSGVSLGWVDSNEAPDCPTMHKVDIDR